MDEYSYVPTKLEWKPKYAVEDRQTEVSLHVWNPNDVSWFWSAYDNQEDEGICLSTLPGYETKEAAMEAAMKWYTETWLPRFLITGWRGAGLK